MVSILHDRADEMVGLMSVVLTSRGEMLLLSATVEVESESYLLGWGNVARVRPLCGLLNAGLRPRLCVSGLGTARLRLALGS
jgi:hypothetical protein